MTEEEVRENQTFFTADVSGETFRDFVVAASALIDKGPMQVCENRLVFKSMDPSQIALMEIVLHDKICRSWKHYENTQADVDVVGLVNLAKTLKIGDKVGLKLEGNNLTVEVKGAVEKTYTVEAPESTEHIPKTPTIDYMSTVKVSPTIVKDILADMKRAGCDHITLRLDQPGLTVTSNFSGEEDNIKVEAKVPDEKLLYMEINKNYPTPTSTYSMEYLEKLVAACDIPSFLTIQYSTDTPIQITYTTAADIQTEYWAAPRIESR